MLLSSLLVIGLAIYLAIKFNEGGWTMLVFGLAITIFLPMLVNEFRAIPVAEFKYEALVTTPDNAKGSQTTIYFNEFQQSGNKIVIEDFATRALHFGDFGNTDKSFKTIIITLSDNDGKFIYTDRVKGKTFDDNVIATQPFLNFYKMVMSNTYRLRQILKRISCNFTRHFKNLPVEFVGDFIISYS